MSKTLVATPHPPTPSPHKLTKYFWYAATEVFLAIASKIQGVTENTSSNLVFAALIGHLLNIVTNHLQQCGHYSIKWNYSMDSITCAGRNAAQI